LFLDTETPVSVYLKVKESSVQSFLFESVEGGRALGRYSIVGIDPVATASVVDGLPSLTVMRRDAQHLAAATDGIGSPLEFLKVLVQTVATKCDASKPRFSGGWVGYFGYDSIRFVEDIPLPPSSGDDMPDLMLGLYTDVIVIDNVMRTVTIVSNTLLPHDAPDEQLLRGQYTASCKRLTDIRSKLEAPLVDPGTLGGKMQEMDPGTDASTYKQWVQTARRYIEAGDVFQVVLSRKEVQKRDEDPLGVYRALRRINPSPYMYFLSLGDAQVIGSSPEMLIRVENGKVETRPIAGTRARGATEEEDGSIERELLADEKEKAEHLMLVDLARNDVGRICTPGSVRVSEFMVVEKYSHVMHICSTVSGTLKDDSSPIDALYACFPAGTLTGAPKIRAMEIISEMEPERRGVYGGAIGYIDFSGNLDTCIAIRTIVAHQGSFRLQAGAGIVYDSDPAQEHEETTDKMSALVEAMEASVTLRGGA
jgi:anthranilate synthase component 1